jgi:hypothetical protein
MIFCHLRGGSRGITWWNLFDLKGVSGGIPLIESGMFINHFDLQLANSLDIREEIIEFNQFKSVI